MRIEKVSFRISARIPRSGSTIVEYGVIGSCVLVLTLVGVQTAGGNLASWFGLLKGDMDRQVSVSNQIRAQQEAALLAQPVTSPEENEGPSSPGGAPSDPFSPNAPYNPIQVSGANGIDLVDYYANEIQKLADKVHRMPHTDMTFALMLDDLADEGHNVAGDERSVLTIFSKYGDSFNFSIQDRYAQTLNRAMTYLKQHPNLLSSADTQTLNTLSNNITQQIFDFLGGSNPRSISYEKINQKFTDAGGGKGAQYVDDQSNAICKQGGANCQKKG